ncbi:MAG: hypothetical protein ABFD91_13670 [Anaerohalosphaeraceae bacterium]
MEQQEWAFENPPNIAVFTTRYILEGKDWINYVSHDSDDGSWQFHGDSSPVSEEDARIVGLKEIVKMDPSILELNDLPSGWYAWRETKQSEWQRAKNETS